jgi:hypothetical protein
MRTLHTTFRRARATPYLDVLYPLHSYTCIHCSLSRAGFQRAHSPGTAADFTFLAYTPNGPSHIPPLVMKLTCDRLKNVCSICDRGRGFGKQYRQVALRAGHGLSVGMRCARRKRAASTACVRVSSVMAAVRHSLHPCSCDAVGQSQFVCKLRRAYKAVWLLELASE